MPIGLLCGFRAEQRIAARISPLVAIGWRNPEAAADLVKQGATLLVSFGIAGALSPALRAGDLIIPTTIIMPDSRHLEANPDIVAKLQGAFPKACHGSLYAGETMAGTLARKRELFAATGALAVDMETASVARMADDSGIPWAVFRAIADESTDALPPAAQAGLKDNGNVDMAAVVRSILCEPRQIPALIRTGRLTQTALNKLRHAVPELQKVLG